MAEMSDYCKAYLARDLRRFPGWTEDLSDLRKDTQEVDGDEVEVARETIGDEDVLYLHDSYVVTDDVFVDQHVVFADVTDAWQAFCHGELGFEVPDLEVPEIPGADAEGPAAGEEGTGESAPA